MINRISLSTLALAMVCAACGGSSSDSENTGGSSNGGTGAKGGTSGTGATGGTGTGGTSAGGSAGAATGGSGNTDGGAKKVGDACTAAGECPAGGSGSPECIADWPGGYCAVADCEAHGHDCPDDPGLGGTATTGGKCVLADGTNAKCLALCATTSDCREGYECGIRTDSAGHGDVKVCVPSASGTGGSGGMGTGGGGMGTGGGSGGMSMDGGMGM